MCINDNPLARATPYLILGIISIIITSLLYIFPFIKKLNKNYIFVVRIIMIIISSLLLFLAFVQYKLIVFKCG